MKSVKNNIEKITITEPAKTVEAPSIISATNSNATAASSTSTNEQLKAHTAPLEEQQAQLTIPPRLMDRLMKSNKEFDEQGMSLFNQISLAIFLLMIIGFYIAIAYQFDLPLDIRKLFKPKWH